MATAVSVLGKRGRAPVHGVETLDGPPRNRNQDLHLALLAGEDLVKVYAQRWNPELKSRIDVVLSSAVAGVDAAISKWVAEACNRELASNKREKRKTCMYSWCVMSGGGHSVLVSKPRRSSHGWGAVIPNLSWKLLVPEKREGSSGD